MTIASRSSRIDDATIEWAASLVETPLANFDPDLGRTSVLEDIERWKAEESRGPGGRPLDAGSIRYTVLAVIVGYLLRMLTNKEVSEAGAWSVLVHELTPAQRERLGMTGCLDGTRYDVIAAGEVPGADDAQRAAAHDATQQEYARMAKVFGAAIALFDPIPYPRTERLRSDDRKAIDADPAHPMRRISVQEEQRNLERLEAIMNKIIAVPALAAPAPAPGYIGDIACDETIVLSHKKRPGVGTRPGRLWSRDPDAGWWNGKGADDDYSGFGYGITLAVRMGRPYGKPVLPLPIGMHVGPSTGGRAAAFRTAERHADLHGLTVRSRDRLAIGDQGYSQKDDWIPTLLDLGYKANMDYGRGWPNDIPIADVAEATDSKGRPLAATGPRILNGCILCPGAAQLHARGTRIPRRGPAPEPVKAIVKRQRTIDLLEAMRMPVRIGLARAKSGRPGRPKAGEAPPEEYTITVQCPASLGLVNCSNCPTANGVPIAGVPTVPDTPSPDDPAMRPRACRQDYVTYRLGIYQAKNLQAEMHGSYIQEDIYETTRSANERVHSQLKHPKSGGITDYGWSEARGIAKRGLLFSLATAVTTRCLIQAWIEERQPTNEREIERRRRTKILAPIKKLQREQRQRSLEQKPTSAA